MRPQDSLRSSASLRHSVRGGPGPAERILGAATIAGVSAVSTLLPPFWAAAGFGGYLLLEWLQLPRHPITQTHEDRATGWHITGLPGSGKTAWAYLQVREFAERGYGGVWLSIKRSVSAGPDDEPRVLEYLPAAARERVHVWAPYAENPLGLNFLRTYLKTGTERELLADQCTELFSRMHPHMSENMRNLVRMGTKALLAWADRAGVEVTIWELYRLMQERAFREQVLAKADKVVRDAFREAEPEGRGGKPKPNQTLLAVRTLLRRMVGSDSLLVALAQTDGIDLWTLMERGEWLICDTPTGKLGPSIAPFLCRCIASRLQMLTDRRPSKAKPFAVFADEFQRYSDATFAMGIETAREYRVCWFLIHQTEGQDLGKDVQTAVGMCGNRIFFQQDPRDGKAAAAALFGQHEPEEFAQLPKRHYLGRLRLHGRAHLVAGVTPALPPPAYELAAAILQRSSAGPNRQQLLAAITARKVGKH